MNDLASGGSIARERPIRVLAFPKYGGSAASTRQRLLQFAPYLAQHGIAIEAYPLLDDGYVSALAAGRRASRIALPIAYARRLRTLLQRRDYDVLWIHYELFPYLPGLIERLATWPGKPIVYDFDDAVFHMYDHFGSRPLDWLLRDKLAPLLSRVDAVVAGNAYLAEYARRYCEATTTIPTVVDTDRYVPNSRPNGVPAIGWIGSPSTFEGVIPLMPLMADVAQSHGGTVRVVGAGPKGEGIAGVTAIPWSEASEIAEVQRMSVGVMPVGHAPFMRGKCGYKLIQYMACGLPVVCSPVGVNCEIVTHGVNGFHATSDTEWRDALDQLLGDAPLRARMGAAGRERAVKRYSLAAQAPRLRAVFATAARKGG